MPKTKSILVVDDEDLVRRFIRTTLSAFGYGEILEARDAAQALDISQSHPRPIHLLISDIVMPGQLDGRDLAKEIHDARPHTRILLMSGYEEHDGSGLPEGWYFIRKPFRPAALLDTIQELLDISSP